MRETDNSPQSDVDEAEALEIGMSLLNARRIASQAIADAERRAREFVMAADLRSVDVSAPSSAPSRIGSPAPGEQAEVDLRSLAAQVDELEEALLSGYQRILGLLDEEPAGDAAGPEAGDARAMSDSGPSTLTDKDGDASANGQSPPFTAYLSTSHLGRSILDDPPVPTPSNGAGPRLSNWAPPDAASRVAVAPDDVAPEEVAPPVEWAKPEPQHSASVPEAPPTATAPPAEPYVQASEPASTSSTLWLLNVIGFSALLIVAVVVLMLANIL